MMNLGMTISWSRQRNNTEAAAEHGIHRVGRPCRPILAGRHGHTGRDRGHAVIHRPLIRQRGTLLGADDVDDPLAPATDAELRDAEVAGVLVQLPHLHARQRVGDGVDRLPLVCRGRDVVVDGGDHRLAPPGLAVGLAQAFEGLRAGDLVHQVPVSTWAPRLRPPPGRAARARQARTD
jgi:hypothetical protein